MVLHCQRCTRPLCEIDPLQLEAGQAGTLRRMLRGLGFDAGAAIDAVLNPTPESISEGFNVRCPDGSCG